MKSTGARALALLLAGALAALSPGVPAYAAAVEALDCAAPALGPAPGRISAAAGEMGSLGLPSGPVVPAGTLGALRDIGPVPALTPGNSAALTAADPLPAPAQSARPVVPAAIPAPEKARPLTAAGAVLGNAARGPLTPEKILKRLGVSPRARARREKRISTAERILVQAFRPQDPEVLAAPAAPAGPDRVRLRPARLFSFLSLPIDAGGESGVTLPPVFGVPTRVTRGAFAVMGLASLWAGLGALKSFAPGLAPWVYSVEAALTGVLLYASVWAHEMGHVLAARIFGWRAQAIVLTPVGGAALINLWVRGLSGFLTALAGPAVSLSLGALPFLAARFLSLPHSILPLSTLLAEINVAMGAFNLLPILPMDGGRMLQSALSGAIGDEERAARGAVLIGRIFGLAALAAAVGFFLLGQRGWALAFLATWLISRAGGSSASAGSRRGASLPRAARAANS